MVSPDIAMLSVFITPWMKPTPIHLRDQCSLPGDHGVQKIQRGFDLGVMTCDDVIGQGLQGVGILPRREILKGADPDVAGRDAGQDCAGQGGFAQDLLGLS